MKKNKNVNFIFNLLDKKMVFLGLFLEALLDFIYYIVPFAFTLFLTLPFTLKKAIIVVSIFIISKTLRVIGNYLITKLIDNYLYKYENLEYEEYFRKLEELSPSTLSKYQTGYLISVIEKVTSLVKVLLQSEYLGMISQEIELFNMSIKENLCLGSPIDNNVLEQYLEELKLNELLEFKEGLNTIVGEKGLKLSTGQKRRINILRSYLMDKEIYILDEPTSNLDKETEDIVVKFILKYFKDKTLIIATHNPEIRKVCNKFYKVENHKLKEE